MLAIHPTRAINKFDLLSPFTQNSRLIVRTSPREKTPKKFLTIVIKIKIRVSVKYLVEMADTFDGKANYNIQISALKSQKRDYYAHRRIAKFSFKYSINW